MATNAGSGLVSNHGLGLRRARRSALGAVAVTAVAVAIGAVASSSEALAAAYPVGVDPLSGQPTPLAASVIPATAVATATGVNCSPNPVQSGKPTTCRAEVAFVVAPTGGAPDTVTFGSNGAGEFSKGGACDLSFAAKEPTGACSVTYTETDANSPKITASYTGNASYSSSKGSTKLTVTVPLDTTSTGVSCTNSTPGVGTKTKCTATVTDTTNGSSTPTGTVSFGADGAKGTFTSVTCTLAAGSCAVEFTPSEAGQTTITAGYGGDSTHSTSSGSFTLNPTGEPLISYQPSCNQSQVEVGQPAECVVVLLGIPPPYFYAPSGEVTWSSSPNGEGAFSDYPIKQGEGGVTGNPCTLPWGISTAAPVACVELFTPSVAGTQTLTAAYHGNSEYAADSATIPLVVTPNETATAVNCGPDPAYSDQASTCTATVTDTSPHPIAPTGNVAFETTGSGNFSGSDSCTLGGSGSESRSCSLTYTQKDAASASLSATYEPDGAHAGSSGSTPLTISPNPTTTAVDCAPTTLAAGAEAKCTATVTDDGPVKSTPTGSVTFVSPVPSGGFIPGRACTLSAKNSESASCELSYSQRVAGSPTIAAEYEGDAAHAPSEGWGGLTVSPNPTTTAVSCSPNPASTSQAVTCKATVTDTGASPVTPTGLANFVSTGAGDFNAVACALAGTGASAECTVNYSQTTAGSPKITASYFGDKNHTGGSGAFTLTVNAAAGAGPTGVSGQTGSHSSTDTTLSAGLKEQVAAVTVGAAKIISGIAASVPVGCAGAAGTDCPITVQLKAVEKLAFGKLVAVESTAKITTKVVVIGTETTTLSAGQSKTVTVSLSRVGKQLLHRFHRLRPKLVVTEAGKTLSTRTVSFTAAR